MSDTVITFPAQKLIIKSMRGSHFKLVINVKDSDGSNYDFTDIDANTDDTTESAHDLRMKIYNSNGAPLGNDENLDPEDPPIDNIHDNMEYSVEDGKLTIEWNSPAPYAPSPGRFKYHIYTISNATTNNSETIWLYGDFLVVDNNPSVIGSDVGI